MNYSEFLFTQLLRDVAGVQIEYDVLWEESDAIYKIYEDSEFNNPNKPEYECMVDFIKHQRETIEIVFKD